MSRDICNRGEEISFIGYLRALFDKAKGFYNSESCSKINFHEIKDHDKKYIDKLKTKDIDQPELQKFNELIDHALIENEIKEAIKKEYKEFFDYYVDKIFINDSDVFPEYDIIVILLEKYFKCLNTLYLYSENFEVDTLKKIITLSLNIGIIECKEDETLGQYQGVTGYITNKSPILLMLFRNIYDFLADENNFENLGSLNIEQDIFIFKILRIVRKFIFFNNELCHMVLPTFLQNYDKCKVGLSIPIRKLNTFNSYEGVNEFRLREKILFELECFEEIQNKEQAEPSVFNILLVGDISATPIYELYREINKTSNIKINIEILTKNNFENEKLIVPDNIGVTFTSIYSGNMNGELLGKMSKANLVMLLDWTNLYKKPEVCPVNNNTFMQHMFQLSNKLNYGREINSNSLLDFGGLMDLVEIFTGFLYSESMGKITVKTNFQIISALSKEYFSKEKIDNIYRSMYVYLSHEEATSAKLLELGALRIEKYNSKNMAILRLGDNSIPVQNLKNAESDKRELVFTLWQLIKHVSISRMFNISKNNTISRLSDVLIKLNYSQWPKCVEISCNDEHIKNIIEDIIIKYFSSCSNIYTDYLKESFVSILLSASRTVDDILFAHIFSKADFIPTIEFSNKWYDENIELIKDEKKMYTRKWLYYETMQDYDTSSCDFPLKYSKLDLLNSSFEKGADVVFQGIEQACEKNFYDKSYLYTKCKDMLND